MLGEGFVPPLYFTLFYPIVSKILFIFRMIGRISSCLSINPVRIFGVKSFPFMSPLVRQVKKEAFMSLFFVWNDCISRLFLIGYGQVCKCVLLYGVVFRPMP